MEEQQQQQPSLAAGYPAPPPFWQSFTTENLERVSSLRAAQPSSSSLDSATALPIRILDLPPELRYLQPPEPPTEGAFRVFGDRYLVRSSSVQETKDPLLIRFCAGS
jgi:mediator of RNA polymerase II transcription subunit 7